MVVTQEKTTRRGTFVYIVYQGKKLGWIDTKAIQPEKVHSTQSVSYNALIVNRGYSIDTQPYGQPNFSNVSKSDNYLNQQVAVAKEMKTDRGTFALISRNGLLIGWVDKRALGNPIVRRTVFLDVGHGGSDPGASYFGVKEKDLNLTVSLLVRTRLENMGYNVILSRTTDVYIDLYERPKMANRSNADIFVSIHHNALGGSSAYGIESYFYEFEANYPPRNNKDMHNDPERIKESIDLSTQIHNQLIAKTRAYDRGIRSGAYVVVRETAIPAALLELGFMSNQAELNKLTSPSYQRTLADAIAQGINSYFK